nr:hypothetical protein [Candidatus Sigynarchaeota archaeon]
VGPVADELIARSLRSKDACGDFASIIVDFFNKAYFSSKEESKLPLASRDLLGLDVWQGPCKIYNIHALSNNTFLMGVIEGNVNFHHEQMDLILENVDPTFFDFFKDATHEVMKYTYSAEVAFVTVEQVFLFCRALWYYVESAVCYHALSAIEKECNITRLTGKILALRESLVTPFLHVRFPENHFYSKVHQMTRDELNLFYDKYLLSKFRFNQHQAFLLSKTILNEVERKGGA